jgi:tRNA pseudouridine55 synthase
MQIITSATDINQVDFPSGAAILIDKPKEWTSFDVVAKVRNTLGKRLGIRRFKVGHAGTLDPLATGLLIVCTGKGTKKIEGFQSLEKGYLATIKLGAMTKTYDSEAEEENVVDASHITKDEVEQVMQQFIGPINQIPPIYSAIKVKGKALYKYARRGETVELKPRPVTIHNITIEEYNSPYIKAIVECSKGTYIRSLAHDIGKALGCGGYLSDLVRTSIGIHSLTDAVSLPVLIQQLTDESPSENR